MAAGWEFRRPGGTFTTLRALGGPLRLDDGGGRQALGLLLRLDAAAPFLTSVGGVLSVRGTMLPNYGDQRLGILAFGFGFRVR